MSSDEKLREELQRIATAGRISCQDARKLAESLGIPPRRVGEACNELKIKICACELGCFK